MEPEIELLNCPYCGNNAEYCEGNNTQADAIYCSECPLGVEHDGMSFKMLVLVWNNLPRNKLTPSKGMED